MTADRQHARPDLADRLLMTFPARHYCLPALFRILEFVETTAVPTASVECRSHPRMLVNPNFMAAHAATPERALMLVLHELHHVILGHTRLYKRVTLLDNFVFDAVINAMLCRSFPVEEYMSLFTGLYRADRFPECFLRPAPGWRPGVEAVPTARRIRCEPHLADLHRALYSEQGVTYNDLRLAMIDCLGIGVLRGIPLLGDHSDERDGASSSGLLDGRSPILLDELERITGRWPPWSKPFAEGSPSQLLQAAKTRRIPPNNRAVLTQLLRRIGGRTGGRIPAQGEQPVEVMSPTPRMERRAVVLGALGAQPMLYRHALPARRRCPSGGRVHVYVDVSGSIGNLVGPIYGAVLACKSFVHPVVHLFSTEIADVTLGQLRRGVCRTTGGTDITCIAEHIRSNRIRRAVLVTDGYVGVPSSDDESLLSKTRLGVALVPPPSIRDYLQGVTDAWAQLQEVHR